MLKISSLLTLPSCELFARLFNALEKAIISCQMLIKSRMKLFNKILVVDNALWDTSIGTKRVWLIQDLRNINQSI